MNSAPIKKKVVTSYDIAPAMTEANKYAASTAKETRPENEPVKFVNLRLKETDYKTIGKLAIDAGITKAAFCKAASLFIADMITQGAMTIGGGGIIDRRG